MSTHLVKSGIETSEMGVSFGPCADMFVFVAADGRSLNNLGAGRHRRINPVDLIGHALPLQQTQGHGNPDLNERARCGERGDNDRPRQAATATLHACRHPTRNTATGPDLSRQVATAAIP